jgi:hypothetical protein
MIPGSCCCPRCCPPPSMTPSSTVDPAIVVAHIVVHRHQSCHCLPSTPMSSLPTSSSAAAAATATAAATAAAAATTAVFSAIAATFWLIVVYGPCPVRYPLPSLPSLSRCSMMLSSHRGRWRRTMPTPAKPMPGSHQVILALPCWCPSPLVATAHSLHHRCPHCHPHRGSGRMIGGGGNDQQPLAGNCIIIANHGRRAA